MDSIVRDKFNINRTGNGDTPVIFAHGYGCDQNMWRFVAPAFEEEYDVILFDHIGSGKSDESAYDYSKYATLEGYADDVIEICESLGLYRTVFVGHSVSAMIGALAAAKQPALFSRLIMVCPSPRFLNDEGYVGGFSEEDIGELIKSLESNYLGWATSITPVIVGDPEQPEFAEELQNSFCRMNPDIAKHFAKVAFTSDHRDDLDDVSTPTLVLQCNPDHLAPVGVGKYVHQNIKQSRYIELDSAGHCPHLTSPQKTIRAIRNDLKEE